MLFGWEATSKVYTEEKPMESIQQTSTYSCRPMWTYQTNFKQQQEVYSMFIDDFSRKTWVYFLHEKSETFSLFKSFKALIEKEVGINIVCLRTYKGGEFTSNEFGEFFQVKV